MNSYQSAGNPNMSSFNQVNREPSSNYPQNNGPQNYGQRSYNGVPNRPMQRPITDAGSSWQSVSRETQSSNPYGRATDAGSSYGAISRDTRPAGGRGGYRGPPPMSDTGASWDRVNIETGSAGMPHSPSNQRARITDSGSSWQSVSREQHGRGPGMGGPRPGERIMGDVGASWDTVNIDTVSSTGNAFNTYAGKRVTDSGSSWKSVARESPGPAGWRRPVTDSGSNWGRVNIETGGAGMPLHPANRRSEVARITDSGSSWRPVDREEMPRGRPGMMHRRPITDSGSSWGQVNTANVSYNSRQPVTDSGSNWGTVSRETQSVGRGNMGGYPGPPPGM